VKMNKEKTTKWINSAFWSLLVIMIVAFVISSVRTDNIKVDFMEKYDQKADSLLKMQEKYRELIQESNLKIEELSQQRQTIIEKQPQIFNRYVTKYITNNSPADTSTFNQVYERSVHEFDSLWQSGFFVTK
jgi:uncharacterized protein with PQ loop repeat